MCINGAAARKVNIGDLIIIASYADYSEKELRSGASRLIMVDGKNSITETRIERWLPE